MLMRRVVVLLAAGFLQFGLIVHAVGLEPGFVPVQPLHVVAVAGTGSGGYLQSLGGGTHPVQVIEVAEAARRT